MTIYLILFALVALLVMWVVAPVMTARATVHGSEHREMLLEQADSLKRSLREAADSHARGKLEDGDFQAIQNRLMVALARTYHQLGIDPDSEDAAPEQACRSCGTDLKAGYQFCPSCGSQAAAA